MPFSLSKHEELILLAVWRLQDDAYGATIRTLLQETTGEDWSIAGVYGPLKRLARAGLVSTRTGLPTPERGGRSKRYYRLTPSGVGALNHARAVHERMWANLPKLALGGS
jgi:DNA-binding PadR family transcriptional regulator